MGLSLYQITTEYLRALDELAGSDAGAEEIRTRLDELRTPLEEKLAAVAAYVLHLEAEAKAMADAEARIRERRTRTERRAARLREYIHWSMEASGLQRVDSPDRSYVVHLRRCPPAVEVYDPETLPADFWHERTTREPDKRALHAVLSTGAVVPGARLIRRTRLEIG